MSLVSYQKHDLGCDKAVDGKICQSYFDGEVGRPAWQVRADAQSAGWIFVESEHNPSLMKDFCPEHVEDL